MLGMSDVICMSDDLSECEMHTSGWCACQEP